jgi:predicted RNA-binding Zn ribbon-like protein
MAPESYLPWLTFPPAVDLANTVRAAPQGRRDLLETEDQLRAWIAAERGRIPDAEAASGHLGSVHELRSVVRDLLYAGARGEPLPGPARNRLNAISAAAPLRVALTPSGEVDERADSPDPYARFEAAIARSAIGLAGRSDAELAVCGAPSCGMLFRPDHPRQVWCTKECGNRARVARHAARRRGRQGRRAPPAPSSPAT